MNDFVIMFAGALLALSVIILGWWLIVASEGVYLGRRMVIWLYDLYAQRYDSIKAYQPEYEKWLLAQPLMGATAPHESPLVLDVATGTGRLPTALLNHPVFQGRVIGVDLSRRMLNVAARNLRPFHERVSLLWCPAESLPFADDAFDVVTCLEALEFMSNLKDTICELIRVLRPGGVLLISNRINTRAMPGKTLTDEQLETFLLDNGMTLAEFEVWQSDYHKVWALKTGDSSPIGARPLDEVLRCPRCQSDLMRHQGDLWVCDGCGGQAQVGRDGVVELFPLYLADN